MANKPFYKQGKFWKLILIILVLSGIAYVSEVSGFSDYLETVLRW